MSERALHTHPRPPALNSEAGPASTVNSHDGIRRLARSAANPEVAPVVIIGAGPAGLTAAYELAKHDVWSTVLEQDSVTGGIARTGEYKGYRFHAGGNGFSGRPGLVERMAQEVLGDDLLQLPRLSRTLRGRGLVEAVRRVFFRSRAEQGAGDTFLYPRYGAGEMWDRAKEMVEERGCHVLFEKPVERVYWEPGRVFAVLAGGRLYQGRQFVSSIPVRELIGRLDPTPPDWVIRSVDDFHYRDLLTVALIIQAPDVFPDNCIQVRDRRVKVARIQNFKNLSPAMAPPTDTTCLGLDYFCAEGDGFWSMPVEDLIGFAAAEVARLGLVRAEDVIDGTAVRIPKAYPVEDAHTDGSLGAVRAFLNHIPNLQLAGRNGMHRDSSQEHSMLTAVLAARNILNDMAGLSTRYDLWRVNVGAEEPDFGALETSPPDSPVIILEPRGVESRPTAVHEFDRTSVVRRLR